MSARNALGEYGERVAVRHLRSGGMQVLARRWRCGLGEIDIIAQDGTCLVICEVKTRRSTAAGGPLDAVTPAKMARLRILTRVWLQERKERSPQATGYEGIRIDVVGIHLPRRGAPQILHVRGAQ